MRRRVDALVIGSGPGGAITARMLAEAGLDVLVVEDGEWIEPGEVRPYSVEQMRRQYRNHGLTVALGLPSVAYTEGRGAGGGSEVNSGFYHRPSPELLERWRREFRIEHLRPDDLAPFQEYVERELSVAPWPDDHGPPPDALQRGAEALGWTGFDVPRWARYSTDHGSVRTEKQTMSRTYLPGALKAGAELWTTSSARRLNVVDGRVTSAEIERLHGGTMYHEHVETDHLFVCCGATQTPALLQRSGLRGRVGANFSVHPTVKVVAEFDDEVNQADDLPTYQVKEFGPWLSFGGSASGRPLIALSLSENWDAFRVASDRWRHQSVYYAATQSEGRGRVQAIPGFRDPLVTYRLTRRDMTALRSGLARLMHLMLAAGARRLYPAIAGAPVVTNRVDAPAAIKALDRRASVMTVHLTGTVAMGEDRERCAADSFGLVHGTRNVRVNDASLLPEAPGINPQGTLMAIAHRNVDHFLSTIAGCR